MEIINLKLSEIKPYEKNAKLHPAEQIKQIKKSIRKFGFNDPLGIWGKENIIVEGHGRFLAAKELGMEELPCIRLDHMTDEERKAYALAHNKLTMNSGFDNVLLDFELDELKLDFDMDDFGFVGGVEDEIKHKDISDKLKDTYMLIVDCENEEDMEKKYDELIEGGYKCRISTL